MTRTKISCNSQLYSEHKAIYTLMIKKSHLDKMSITKKAACGKTHLILHICLLIGYSRITRQLDSSITSQIKTALDLLLLKNKKGNRAQE